MTEPVPLHAPDCQQEMLEHPRVFVELPSVLDDLSALECQGARILPGLGRTAI